MRIYCRPRAGGDSILRYRLFRDKPTARLCRGLAAVVCVGSFLFVGGLLLQVVDDDSSGWGRGEETLVGVVCQKLVYSKKGQLSALGFWGKVSGFRFFCNLRSN